MFPWINFSCQSLVTESKVGISCNIWQQEKKQGVYTDIKEHNKINTFLMCRGLVPKEISD